MIKPVERKKIVEELRMITSRLNYDDLYSSQSFASKVIEESQKVCFRRFVITAPRDNFSSEPFKFSSRHSEFIKLKAEALLSDANARSPFSPMS